MRRPQKLVVLMALGLLVSVSGRAQTPDHLECYKVKDSLAKTQYTATLAGIAAEPGCVIKTPAKQLCVQTTKTAVSPTPPGAPAGAAAGTFLCYKVKCAQTALPVVSVVDQFGARSVQPKPSRLLCAPVVAATTSTTTTTTTLPASACTIDTDCSPCGSCGAGLCFAGGPNCIHPDLPNFSPVCIDTDGCMTLAGACFQDSACPADWHCVNRFDAGNVFGCCPPCA